MSSIEEIRTKIAQQEKERRAVLELEEQEAIEKAKRERIKKNTAAEIERLQKEEAELMFAKALEENNAIVQQNAAAVKEMQTKLSKIVTDLQGQLAGIAQSTHDSFLKQQQHEQKAVTGLWSAKYRNPNLSARAGADLDRVSQRASFERAVDVYAAIMEIAQQEKDLTRRRTWQAIAYMITGVEP